MRRECNSGLKYMWHETANMPFRAKVDLTALKSLQRCRFSSEVLNVNFSAVLELKTPLTWLLSFKCAAFSPETAPKLNGLAEMNWSKQLTTNELVLQNEKEIQQQETTGAQAKNDPRLHLKHSEDSALAKINDEFSYWSIYL